MMRRAMACPVAVTTDTTTTASGKLFLMSFTNGLVATISPTEAACNQIARLPSIFFINVLGMNPALCFIRS